jgi:hypothetical protein
MDPADITRNILMYFILPLWLAAGFADYLCHRAAHIEQTSGVKESILHLLQFVEMGIPLRLRQCESWRASERTPQRFFRGTFFPFLRALESAMAIACLRLFTLPPLPPRPLLARPRL